MNNIEIRMIDISDANTIQIICTQDLGYECNVSLVEEKIKSLNMNREQVFVACKSGIVTGFIHIEKYDTLYFETMCNILGLAVKKEFRKKGIGKELLFAAENWAKEKGIKCMRLNSGITRAEAHTFYKNLGYVSEKQQLRFIKKI